MDKNSRDGLIKLGAVSIGGILLGKGIEYMIKKYEESKMTEDEYILEIINQKKLTPVKINDERIKPIKTFIIDCYKSAEIGINEIKLSGSSAKDTAMKGSSDIDLFISLKDDNNKSLKDIYTCLYEYVNSRSDIINPRKQNVSIGINYNGLEIDLVPGRQQTGYKNWHSLYLRKKDSRIQTNIDLHISMVINSGRLNEIRATKIWREINKIDFPSIYLELSVMEALRNKRKDKISENFSAVLAYLRDEFVEKTIIDPANSNNDISASLYKKDKQEIAGIAGKSLLKDNWEDIIW